MDSQFENTLLEQLLESPRLPLYARKIREVLDEEAQRRRAFYDQIREGDKVEFINGEIIYHSPVRLRHDNASGNLYRLLSSYVSLHDLGYVGHEKLMISLSRNDYEPDICFFSAEKAAGFEPDQMRFPAPDLIVEVLSASTAANDRGIKFDDYAAHGVAEYWLLEPATEGVEQYRLNGQAYELLLKAKTGEIQSIVVPGFTISIRAIFDEREHRAALRAPLTA
jgi:Uma2 family endonuclease